VAEDRDQRVQQRREQQRGEQQCNQEALHAAIIVARLAGRQARCSAARQTRACDAVLTHGRPSAKVWNAAVCAGNSTDYEILPREPRKSKKGLAHQ
jgi:hypothetical protein